MTERYARIRTALAMGPTPGPWEVINGRDVFTRLGARNAAGAEAAANDGWHIADCDMGPSATEEGEADIPYVEKRANTALIAACDPDTVRALLAERDELAEQLFNFKARARRAAAMSESKCAHCNGSGKEAQVYDEQTGWSDEKACDTCNGSGRITTVEQYLKTLPANWHEDSGLATWFPLVAEEIELLRKQRDELLAALRAAPSERGDL